MRTAADTHQVALEAIFQAPVDLLVGGAVNNRYFLRATEQDRLLLYYTTTPEK